MSTPGEPGKTETGLLDDPGRRMPVPGCIAVAMSGGVDSSVAAALLLEGGHEVVGLTMCFDLPDGDGKRPSCCGVQAIEDARRVARALGIPHYVLNMQQALNEKVIADFVSEYVLGRTPNPCVRCNQYIKFGALLDKAAAIGASHLATGHYARIIQRGEARFIARAVDAHKDQSYFLHRADQRQLSQLLFPIGAYTKAQVRDLGTRLKLPVAGKPDSQEICFLPDNDYRGFLRRMGHRDVPGPIRTVEGKEVGTHRGVAYYTIGQRAGVGVALGRPAYVVSLDAATNTVVLGTRDQACATACTVGQVHFVDQRSTMEAALCVQIRHNHSPAPATILAGTDSVSIVFSRPQFAVTPGQAAVFYDGDRVVGGGVIEKVRGAATRTPASSS